MAHGLDELLDQVYNTGVPYIGHELPLKLRGETGELVEHYFTFICQATREFSGAVSDVAVFGLDAMASVLARREAERLAEERRFAFEVLDRGEQLVVLDAEWRVTFVKPPYEELSRQPRSELLGRNYWSAFPELAREDGVEWRAFHRARHTREPEHAESYFSSLGLWTQLSSFPTRNGGVAVFSRAVTARKATETHIVHLVHLAAARSAERGAGSHLREHAGRGLRGGRVRPQSHEPCRLSAARLRGRHRARPPVHALTEELELRDAATGELLAAEQAAFARALRGETLTLESRIRRRQTGAKIFIRTAAAPIF